MMLGPIAISLVGWRFPEMLEEMLQTLAASDLQQWPHRLFYWGNEQSEMAQGAAAVRRWFPNAVCDLSVSNAGIVRPRISLYESATASEHFAWLLEVHQDMLFPRVWFAPLAAAAADADVGFVMPLLFRRPRPSLSELDGACAIRRVPGSWPAVEHSFPWLARMQMLQTIGYYDAAYHPMGWEDNDLFYRASQAGWRASAVGDSVVYHEGAGVRGRLLPNHAGCRRNAAVFRRKFAVEWSAWRDQRRRELAPVASRLHQEVA